MDPPQAFTACCAVVRGLAMVGTVVLPTVVIFSLTLETIAVVSALPVAMEFHLLGLNLQGTSELKYGTNP